MLSKLQDLYYAAYRGCRKVWNFVRYDFHQGVGNLVRWFPIIWQDRDWDHAYLLQIMEFKFRRMSDLHKNYGNTVSAPRIARQLQIAAHLCHRIYDEPYSDNSRAFYTYATPAWAKEWNNVQKQDKEMLGRLIGKYIDHWWD